MDEAQKPFCNYYPRQREIYVYIQDTLCHYINKTKMSTKNDAFPF